MKASSLSTKQSDKITFRDPVTGAEMKAPPPPVTTPARKGGDKIVNAAEAIAKLSSNERFRVR